MRKNADFGNIHLYVVWWLGLLFLFILAGCGPAQVNRGPVSEGSYPTNGAYPPPQAAQRDLDAAYPAQTAAAQRGTLLAFDKPVRPGDTVLSGVGPAGLPVFVVNITFMGEEVGSGVIGQDGTFSINVAPLPGGVRLGLAADLVAVGLTEADVRPGDEEISTPRVGYFYDSVVIPQED